MLDKKSLRQVEARIAGIFGEKAIAVQALCRKYATIAQRTARDSQGTTQNKGQFWTNRTTNAIKGIEGYTVNSGGDIGFGLKHTMDYGLYLEFARGRSVRPLLEPTIRTLTAYFIDDVKKRW